MPVPSTTDEFLEVVRKSGVVSPCRLEDVLRHVADPPADLTKLARSLVAAGLLTHFQMEQFLLGKWRGFEIGNYTVVERLGCGGGGNVYLCRHRTLGHRMAVKVLSQLQAEDPAQLERFRREARLGASLRHPNLVRTYDFDRHNGLFYLVMDYVDGRSLGRTVGRHGPLEIPQAADYVRQAALGLQYAHAAGVVHRDVNPGNLLVDRRGVVKILDLGVAHWSREDSHHLSDGVILGTADYLAPEQAVNSHEVDARADVYSLGATFYYLLAGRPPFAEARTVAKKLICHQSVPPRPVHELRPEVPQALEAVLDRMMAKDPAERYQTAGEVAAVLGPWAAALPPHVHETKPRSSAAVQSNGRTGATPWDLLPDPAAADTSTAASAADTMTAAPGDRAR